MAAVRWLPAAYDDLDELRRYIARDRPRVAEQLASRIVLATRRLAAFPRSGRMVPEFERTDIREIIVDSFRVVYSVVGEHVSVLAVRHGARRLGEMPDF